ncbi:AbrB/MazE/SpoVT family DNA-binding domain-containing protein [Acidobacteria bacterium AH-259-A15]|nr:AbrB/MazE/SpoVT family DNA-binding domain-containing protein [Acidobacteria bacterium AH-259-A15]
MEAREEGAFSKAHKEALDLALCRAYGRVDEDGRITLPRNVRGLVGVEANEIVVINALRIESTTRYPHAVLFLPHHPPALSSLEVVMEKAQGIVDGTGQITLPPSILEEMRLEQGYRVEMKVQGSHNQHWVVLYNRGPWRETTVRQRMGVDRGKPAEEKKHKTQVWEY